MSFKLGLPRVPELLVIALMLVFIFGVLYSSIELEYKIGIGALVFTIILLTTVAMQVLKQEEERKRIQQR